MAPPTASTNSTTVGNDGVSEQTFATHYGTKLRQLYIPAPRARIAARIDDLAELIGGSSHPFYCGPHNLLVGARLPTVRLIILGTACRRPLLCEEARDLQAITREDVLVLRLEEAWGSFTCDFLDAETGNDFSSLRPWMEAAGGTFWLASHNASEVWIQPREGGSQLGKPPKVSQVNLEKGFDAARKLLPGTQTGLWHA